MAITLAAGKAKQSDGWLPPPVLNPWLYADRRWAVSCIGMEAKPHWRFCAVPIGYAALPCFRSSSARYMI